MRHPHIAILVASFTFLCAGGAAAQYPAKPARINALGRAHREEH